MISKPRKKIDHSKTLSYYFLIDDWTIDVEFNRFASIFACEFDREFEESSSIVLNGHLFDSTADNKKIKKGLFASLHIIGDDSLYYKRTQYSLEDDHTIGKLVYQRFFERSKKGHFLRARVYIPMKSYETVMAYLVHKGKACVCISGTELEKTEFRSVLRGDIYYIQFHGEERVDTWIE